ncbi:MAG: FtsQ-type POTRA domain-containing protein [Defluviitaleaceae bacterium]|nr:FtsQ-type POTRA domain-containing protein [Defluviitaleaceae bacterium]
MFLISPFFGADEIIIVGNINVSQTEIEDRLDLVIGDNILLFNTAAARARIMENLYIDSVAFTRELPGRITVTVRERRLVAYIEHSPGSFLFIDENGRVLEVRSSFAEPLPVVTGLSFNSFQLGEILDVPNRAAFNIIAQYASALQRQGLAEAVTHIDVSDIFNTRIIFPNLIFEVGDDAHNAYEKMRIIAAVLSELPATPSYRGIFDLRVIDSEYILSIIT